MHLALNMACNLRVCVSGERESRGVLERNCGGVYLYGLEVVFLFARVKVEVAWKG